jgi:hypothetical protein
VVFVEEPLMFKADPREFFRTFGLASAVVGVGACLFVAITANP